MAINFFAFRIVDLKFYRMSMNADLYKMWPPSSRHRNYNSDFFIGINVLTHHELSFKHEELKATPCNE